MTEFTEKILNGVEVSKKLEELSNIFSDEKEKCLKSHLGWKDEYDARIAVYQKIINVLRTILLSMIYAEHYLAKESFWKKISPTSVPGSSPKFYLEVYVTFTKLSLLQFFFSQIESSFRTFLKALDSHACSNGTADFKSIYSCLLSKLDLKKYEPLLDLLRCFRNTVHNNGVYFHRSGSGETVVYKGEKYEFIIGKGIILPFVLLLDLLFDSKNLIVEVVESKEISDLGEIKDPWIDH